MKFEIQIGNPVVISRVDEDDENIAHALETIYPMLTESLYMQWNWIHIPIGYKYDLSWIWEDIMDLLKKLLESDKGKCKVTWPSNTFRVDWDVSWSNNRIEITSTWHDVAGKVEDLLNKNNRIEMPLEAFLAEWKALLRKVLESLEKAGYDEKQLPDIKETKEVESKIAGMGILYQDPKADAEEILSTQD